MAGSPTIKVVETFVLVFALHISIRERARRRQQRGKFGHFFDRIYCFIMTGWSSSAFFFLLETISSRRGSRSSLIAEQGGGVGCGEGKVFFSECVVASSQRGKGTG